MNELIEKKVISKDYGITIREYLTLAEIQAISNSARKFESWGEREQNIIALLLHFATDIEDEEIENISISKMEKAGLVDYVKTVNKNWREIYSAIKYEESIEKSLTQIIKTLNAPIKEATKNAKNPRKK